MNNTASYQAFLFPVFRGKVEKFIRLYKEGTRTEPMSSSHCLFGSAILHLSRTADILADMRSSVRGERTNILADITLSWLGANGLPAFILIDMTSSICGGLEVAPCDSRSSTSIALGDIFRGVPSPCLEVPAEDTLPDIPLSPFELHAILSLNFREQLRPIFDLPNMKLIFRSFQISTLIYLHPTI